MPEEKEWSENPEDDPILLQKKQLELGKRFLEKIEAQEKEEKRRKEEYAAAGPVEAPVYTPPSFEQVSSVIKKAWDELEKIMPTAPDRVKERAFETLMHAAAPPPGYLG